MPKVCAGREAHSSLTGPGAGAALGRKYARAAKLKAWCPTQPITEKPATRRSGSKEQSISDGMTNGQNRQGRRSHAAAKPAKLKDGREKITLLVSKETNVKLSTLAALKGVARSPLSPGEPDRGAAGRRDLAERRAGGRGRGGR
jgi:hypothetical protein